MLLGLQVGGTWAHQGWLQLGRTPGFWLGLGLVHEVSVILRPRLKRQQLLEVYPFQSWWQGHKRESQTQWGSYSANFPLAKASHIAKPKGRDVHSAHGEAVVTAVKWKRWRITNNISPVFLDLRVTSDFFLLFLLYSLVTSSPVSLHSPLCSMIIFQAQQWGRHALSYFQAFIHSIALSCQIFLLPSPPLSSCHHSLLAISLS